MTDAVNHPSHYADGWSNGAEIIDITENLNFNRGNAVKYIARAGRKDAAKELEDLEKAQFYINREVDRVRAVIDPPKEPYVWDGAPVNLIPLNEYLVYADPIPWLDAVPTESYHWVIKLDTLPTGLEGLWESTITGYVYWFVEGGWWIMDPDSEQEDPWSRSAYYGRDVPPTEGPFTSYVAPQQD